jgi:hypothetical protein
MDDEIGKTEWFERWKSLVLARGNWKLRLWWLNINRAKAGKVPLKFKVPWLPEDKQKRRKKR